MLFIIQNTVIVNRNADFFYKTNRFESIRDSNRFESIRIANRNALLTSRRCIIIIISLTQRPKISMFALQVRLVTLIHVKFGMAQW